MFETFPNIVMKSKKLGLNALLSSALLHTTCKQVQVKAATKKILKNSTRYRKKM